MSKGMLFYRCLMCGMVVSKWDIKKYRGCSKCAGKKISPTNLSFTERVRQLLKHPRFWKWDDDADLYDGES